MAQQFQTSDPSAKRTRLSRIPGLFLALLSATLITAVACGTDRDNGDGAAQQFQVSEDSMTWSPPWKQGDARTISMTASAEFSPELQEQFDAMQAMGGGSPDYSEPQTSTVGVVTILSKNSNGATGELVIAMDELFRQLETQTMQQPGMGGSDLEQYTAMLGMMEQLDLGVEFQISDSGAVTGVTNLDELAQEIQEFANSMIRLAVLAGEGAMSPEDVEMLETALAELPETETARVVANAALNGALSNMFLMRSGEYTVGEPVIVSGRTPTLAGLETDGTYTFELTGISNGAATMQVTVSPGEVDLLAMAAQFANEIAGVIGEDASEFTDGIAELDDDERAMIDAVAGMLFKPYTVTLTLDAATGWVTAADWSVYLALPEGFEDLIPEEERDFEEFSPEDFAVTLDMRATFS